MNFTEFARELAKDAGEIIKSNFSFDLKKEWKTDQTPVTIADNLVNELVVKRISEAYPEHGILIEELDTIKNPQSSLLWVCDPIDGTFPYSNGIPTAIFSLALVENGKPILGVCYDPFLDRLYSSDHDSGATLNGHSIQVNQSNNLNHCVVGISLWKNAKYNLAPLVPAVQDAGALPINLASNIYMGALVAAGSLSAVVYNDDKPYDAAALKHLVEAAGGKVTDLFGEEQDYSKPLHGLLVTNGKIHDQMLELIRENLTL